MNAHTKMSERGQVVIPKEVRDRLRIAVGDRLEVVERPDGVLLRKPSDGKSGRSFEEITVRLREIASAYNGPPVSIEEMNETIAEGWRDAALRSDCARDRH